MTLDLRHIVWTCPVMLRETQNMGHCQGSAIHAHSMMLTAMAADDGIQIECGRTEFTAAQVERLPATIESKGPACCYLGHVRTRQIFIDALNEYRAKVLGASAVQ